MGCAIDHLERAFLGDEPSQAAAASQVLRELESIARPFCHVAGTAGRSGGTDQPVVSPSVVPPLLPIRPPDPVPANPDPPDAPAADSAAPSPPRPSTPPESPPPQSLFCLSLDRIGLTQAISGFILGLIALFSSYDHITLAGTTIGLQRQWGILFIAASVATVVVDSELASRSRLRAEGERQVDRDRADQERNRADQERNRADQERNRAAEARERQDQVAERQNEDFALLRRSALLSGRVQLDPNSTNRARFQFFLTLLAQSSLEQPEA